MRRACQIFLMFIFMGLPFDSYAATQCGNSIFCRTLRLYSKFNWFHNPFASLFDISNSLASDACKTLLPMYLSFLGLAFLFWILFRVGRVVIDITPAPDTQLLPDLFKKLLRVMVASLLLFFYVDVFSYIIDPALEMAIGVGNTISLNQMRGSIQQNGRGGFNLPQDRNNKTLCEDYRNGAGSNSSNNGGENDQVFTESVKQAFLCYVDIGHYTMVTGMALGATAVISWTNYGLIDKVRRIQLLFIGIILFCAHFILMLVFPTKLFDPLMTLTFLATLFPLWIVLWTFEATKKYCDKARDLFIGVLVHLVVISVVSAMVVKIMDSALGDKETQTAIYVQLMKGRPEAFTVFTETKGFGLVGVSVVFTFALAWLAVKMFEKVGPIAAQFENVIDFGVGQSSANFISRGTGLVADTGKQAVAGTYHAARGGWKRLASRDDAWGRAARGIGSVAAGAAAVAAAPVVLPAALPAAAAWLAATGMGLGATAAAHRFMPVPKNRPHGNSLFDNLNVETYEDDSNRWKVNRRGGQSSHQDKTTKEWDKYNKNTQVYEEFDKAGRLQNVYDRNNGKISLMNQKYEFSIDNDGTLTIKVGDEKYSVDASGVVKNMIDGSPVAEQKANEIKNVADFQRHAEQRISEHEALLTSPRPTP